MAQLTVTFEGICVHLAQSTTPALPANYRVILPQVSIAPVWQTISLGTLTPMLSVTPGNLPDFPSGNLTITSSQPVGSIPTVPSAIPNLIAMAPAGFTIDPAIALAAVPASGFYIDINTPGTMTADVRENNQIITIASTLTVEAEGFTLTLTTPTSVAAISFSADLTFSATNGPQATLAGSAQVLLGFLAVSPSVPPNAILPLIHPGEFGNPGCSNSQWP